MGVKGLTTFIARNAELYLKPFELHDCNLVIDGDNLACNLYKDVSGRNSAFSGDYDAFYRTVVEFFHVLSECNIRAYVLMDGGYEKKKLRTVWQRLRGKISIIKHINPMNSRNIFPLMMREVFIDALHDCGIPVMRCVFEADDELAALGRKLNCPVLSYDSDFYIHNVKYIPLVTLTVKAHTKRLKKADGVEEHKKLSMCHARQLEKRTKAHTILKEIHVDAEDRKAPKTGKTYKYLDCCMYKIEYLIRRGALSKEKLPLFAVLLGNDYIARSAFKNFYHQMALKGTGKKSTRLQKRISRIIQFLKHETVESALEKILGTLKKVQRSRLLAQISSAMEGYNKEECISYEFFSSYYKHVLDVCTESVKSDDEGDVGSDLEEDDEEEEVSGEEDVEAEEEEDEEVDEGQEKNKEEVEEKSSDSEERKNASDKKVASSNPILEESGGESEKEDEEELDAAQLLPQWFKDRLYPAKLSRFFVDLAHLRIYINNPQIEHFPFNDCNEISLPILKHIFALLSHVGGGEENTIYKTPVKKQPSEEAEDQEELVPYFRYVTRVKRITNIQTIRYPLDPPPEIEFDPARPDPRLFQAVFSGLQIDTKKLFIEIEKVPRDLRLYLLAMVYWIQRSSNADLLHLHALLICLVTLRTIDSKVEPIRNEAAFRKKFGKIISKEKLLRAKEEEEGTLRDTRSEIKALAPPKRMAYVRKTDCLLVQEDLLKHFHMQEIFKKKYDSFSSTVLHGFSEFQSVVFNLKGLSSLLGDIYDSPKMAQLYCGVFLYNIYGLLRSRVDLMYFVQHHIFRWSPMMFEFYEFLWNWCDEFIPHWQRNKKSLLGASKNVLRKRKTAAKKRATGASSAEPVNLDPNSEMVDQSDDGEEDEDEFFDLNNKFCTLLKVG